MSVKGRTDRNGSGEVWIRLLQGERRLPSATTAEPRSPRQRFPNLFTSLEPREMLRLPPIPELSADDSMLYA